MHESDVARPKQALIDRATGGGEETHGDSHMARWRWRQCLATPCLSTWPGAAMARAGRGSRSGRVPSFRTAAHVPASVRPAGLAASRESLAGADPEVEPVLRRGQRTGPARIEGARRLEREVEVEDQRPPRLGPARRRDRRSWRRRRGSDRRRRSRRRSSRRETAGTGHRRSRPSRTRDRTRSPSGKATERARPG